MQFLKEASFFPFVTYAFNKFLIAYQFSQNAFIFMQLTDDHVTR